MDKILDIGCGNNKISGAICLDFDKNVNPDILHDLNVFPYPIESNAFDKIYAKHIIEHLDAPDLFMQEMYRILKPGGRVFVETPHFSCRVAYSEPQHKHFFSYFMFSNILSKTKFKIVEQKITFHKSFRFWGIAWWANKNPDKYERFWTYIFPAENVILWAEK